MLSTTCNLSSIKLKRIGLPFKAVRSTVGQPFNSNGSLTLATGWMFPSRYEIEKNELTKYATCDDFSSLLQSGTNKLIFAYGLFDPDLSPSGNDITYHENRRGSRILSLRAYTAEPLSSEFVDLDSFEFRLDNVRPFYFGHCLHIHLIPLFSSM